MRYTSFIFFANFCIAGVSAQASSPDATCHGTPFAPKAPETSLHRVEDWGRPMPASKKFDPTTQSGPFHGIPPEITFLRRGIYSQYIGGHTDNGRSEWKALDVETGDLIVVTRHVWGPAFSGNYPFKVPNQEELLPEIKIRTWVSADQKTHHAEIIRGSVLKPADG